MSILLLKLLSFSSKALSGRIRQMRPTCDPLWVTLSELAEGDLLPL